MSSDKNNKEIKEIPIKVYGKYELASLYGVDWRTLKNWILTVKDIDYSKLENKRSLPPNIVSEIFDAIGRP